jgi:hypothetical protein
MNKHLHAFIGAAMIVAATTAVARAQTGTAEMVGEVVDLAGAPVPNATITVTNVATTNERRFTADAQGRFMAIALTPGGYAVTADAPGFAPRRQEELVLAPDERATVQLALRRAPLPETLTVAETPAGLEIARTDFNQTIELEQLENLPNREREPLALSKLVVATTVNRAERDAVVMAHDPSLNTYTVDGFNRDNRLVGGSQILVPLSAVAAVDERVNGYSVEARGAAAVFNVATRPGTNRMHGSLFNFFGDRRLNALKTIDQPADTRPPYRSNQFGAVIGGPIAVNRDFFLVSYEGTRRTVAGGTSVDFSPFASSSPRSVALAQLQTRAARDPRHSDRDMWMVKANHELSGGGTLRLHYAERRNDGVASVEIRPAPVAVGNGEADGEARMFGGLVGVAAGRFVNEVRAQYAIDRDREAPGSPALTVFQGGALVLRTGSLLGPHDFQADRVQVSEVVSVASGRHAAKAGVEALLDQNDIDPSAMTHGAYVFRSLASFAGGVPAGSGESFTQTVASSRGNISADVRTYAAFVQDTWRISPAATADVGVRYDVQAFVRGVPRDTDNWAPRIGLAIRRGDHAVIRSGYGLYYGSTPALIPALALGDSGFATATVTTTGAATARYPNLLAGLPLARRAATVVNPQFENALLHQAHVGYEVEKYRVGSIGLTYLFARGMHLPRLIEATDRGAFSRVAEYQSTGESVYNALTFRSRLTRPSLSFDLAYTLARMNATPLGATSVQFGTTADRNIFPVIAQERRSPGDDDHRHHLVASLVYDTTSRANTYSGFRRMLLRHWTFSFTYDVLSGAPYSAYADADLNGDGNAFNDLAPGTTRNHYRLPSYMTFNPRAARDFRFGDNKKVTILWQAFNLTNRPNYVAGDDVLYTLTTAGLQRNPLFRRATAQDEGRMMQVAARLSF